MKTLTLIRHAKSSWDDVSLTDAERPLNRRGQRDAPKMAERLVARGVNPDLIIASPAVRASTTADIIAGKLEYPRERIVREASLYLASLDELLDITAMQDDALQHLVLVGHNPGMTLYANRLVPGLTNNVPTTGVVSVSLDRDDWSLYADPGATLKFFDYPKKLGAH
ncbi:MAG: histidine phosphatase family protein [Pseudomonadota bacterium]